MVISSIILDDNNHNDNKINDRYDKQAQILTDKSFKRCTMMSVMAVRCLCSQYPLSLWLLTESIVSEAASKLTDLHNIIITVHRMILSHTVLFTFVWYCTMSRRSSSEFTPENRNVINKTNTEMYNSVKET